MDLKKYFRKVREIEAAIAEAFVLVTSLETADGGKAGVVSEVPRSLAAKMIAEGCAALATKEERDAHFETQELARATARKAELAKKLQVTIVSDNEHNARVATLPIQNGPKPRT